MSRERRLLRLVIWGTAFLWASHGGAPSLASAAGKMQLYMGSTQMVSSFYAPSVSLASIINKNVPQVNVTVVESDATYDNIERTRSGEFQLSMPSSYSGLIESYYGLERFKGRADNSVRVMFVNSCSVVYVVVRADSGITDIRGLQGKKFYAGPMGHLSTVVLQQALEDSAIRPNYFIGGLGDAVTAMKDNRIVGLAKFCVGTQLDAAIIDVKEMTPIRILSLTEKQVDFFVKKASLTKLLVPKGEIKALPDAGPILAPYGCTTCWTTNKLPEEIGYGIVKAACENWKTIASVFEAAKYIDPVKTSIDTLSSTPKVVPFHAGAVKYFRERRMNVPANLIPPEYKK